MDCIPEVAEKRSWLLYSSRGDKSKPSKDSDGRFLVSEFLRGFLCNIQTVDPKNNALLCCAALLLDLSCVIHDFAEHLRATCLKEIFGCCVITNAPDQLDTLSGNFVHDGSDEMDRISSWLNGKADGNRVEYTLSIGGESGSGKTRAALQCAKRLEGRREYGSDDSDYLTVYIKLSKEDDETLKDKNVASYFLKGGDREAAVDYIETHDLRSAKDVDELIRHSDKTYGEDYILTAIRARLCFDFVRRKIYEITGYSIFHAERKFKQVFFVFDEAAACPWVYRSVNQVMGGCHTLPEYFRPPHRFCRKIQGGVLQYGN
ncbi:hypothetical protein ADEAN_000992700 [Angomonas deanei]|uniref:Uncharacterized protein n=1 Tax=Angomonas deanei TaxID=59799 RepID=A0A7G2CVD6_9TRYP|nr:hypothetical protein ADEAN_000992700 [Angomonas deanei]